MCNTFSTVVTVRTVRYVQYVLFAAVGPFARFSDAGERRYGKLRILSVVRVCNVNLRGAWPRLDETTPAVSAQLEHFCCRRARLRGFPMQVNGGTENFAFCPWYAFVMSTCVALGPDSTRPLLQFPPQIKRFHFSAPPCWVYRARPGRRRHSIPSISTVQVTVYDTCMYFVRYAKIHFGQV